MIESTPADAALILIVDRVSPVASQLGDDHEHSLHSDRGRIRWYRWSAAAVDWAVGEGRSRNVPVRLVTAYELDLDYPYLLAYNEVADEERNARNRYQQLVSNHVREVRRAAPEAVVEGRAIEGNATDVLCDESGGASLVVVGHRNRRGDGLVLLGSVAAGVVASSVCPVVVLRNVPPSDEGGVVAGIDGGPTSQTVLEFAFEYASRHGMPVTAAMCIPPLLHRPGSGDGAHLDKARRWLFEATSGWRERYPDVALDHVVVTDHTVDGLVQTAIGQRLLVVGVNRDHHRIGAILGSVANGLLHHAPCAVAAVPVHAKGLKRG